MWVAAQAGPGAAQPRPQALCIGRTQPTQPTQPLYKGEFLDVLGYIWLQMGNL
jgi:hypothetical protein